MPHRLLCAGFELLSFSGTVMTTISSDSSKTDAGESTPAALVLFAHGARDPRWSAPFQKLQQLTQVQMPDVDVHLAYLELMEPRLPDTVAQLALRGCRRVTIVPVFLGQGAHVLRDLPLIIEQLQFDHPEVDVAVAGAVGEDPQVLDAIALCCIRAMGTAPHCPPL